MAWQVFHDKHIFVLQLGLKVVRAYSVAPNRRDEAAPAKDIIPQICVK